MTSPPPPQPSAGWYPDPTGKPGQMYWDGEAWHRLTPDIPATPQADIPGTPKPTQPPVTTKGPSGLVWFVLAGLALLAIAAFLLVGNPTQRGVLIAAVAIVIVGVWMADRSGQFAARTVMFVMAGLVAIAVLVVANYPYLYKTYCTNTPTCRYYGPLSSPSSSSPGSQQSQSPYYQEGYNSGTSGLARNGYGDDMYNTGATVAEMEHNACSAAINNESNNASIQDADQPGNQDDYLNGCLHAFRDHPPAAKPKPGPLDPYR
jgi:Protein of unknown function (DUF2510)